MEAGRRSGALHRVRVQGRALQRAALPGQLPWRGRPADDGPGRAEQAAADRLTAAAAAGGGSLIIVSVYHSNLGRPHALFVCIVYDSFPLLLLLLLLLLQLLSRAAILVIEAVDGVADLRLEVLAGIGSVGVARVVPAEAGRGADRGAGPRVDAQQPRPRRQVGGGRGLPRGSPAQTRGRQTNLNNTYVGSTMIGDY